jgi:hypothetical protein
MKKKVKEALRGLLENVEDHEAETEFSAVSVDLGDLKRLLRWAQNSAYVWFEGDRVKLTGVRVPYDFLEDGYSEGLQGTVYADSEDDGTAIVEWDDAPEDLRRVRMFHNEIKKIK